jgi:hypothetical protein
MPSAAFSLLPKQFNLRAVFVGIVPFSWRSDYCSVARMDGTGYNGICKSR